MTKSNLLNPFGYFEGIYSDNTIDRWYSDFIDFSDTNYESAYNVVFGPDKLTYTYEEQDNETGLYETLNNSFKEVFNKRVYDEFQKSKHLIYELIYNGYNSKKEFESTIDNDFLPLINSLKDSLDNNHNLFEIKNDFLDLLIRFINHCRDGYNVIRGQKEFLDIQLKNSSTVLDWKGNINCLGYIFHQLYNTSSNSGSNYINNNIDDIIRFICEHFTSNGKVIKIDNIRKFMKDPNAVFARCSPFKFDSI
jgi:hypothetical protein